MILRVLSWIAAWPVSKDTSLLSTLKMYVPIRMAAPIKYAAICNHSFGSFQRDPSGAGSAVRWLLSGLEET